LAFATFLVWLLRIGCYGLALAALALVVFGAYDSYPQYSTSLAVLFRNVPKKVLSLYFNDIS